MDLIFLSKKFTPARFFSLTDRIGLAFYRKYSMMFGWLNINIRNFLMVKEFR